MLLYFMKKKILSLHVYKIFFRLLFERCLFWVDAFFFRFLPSYRSLCTTLLTISIRYANILIYARWLFTFVNFFSLIFFLFVCVSSVSHGKNVYVKKSNETIITFHS